MCAGKAQQFGDLVFVGKVFAQTFFEHCAKFVVELGELAHVLFVFVARICGGHIAFGQVFERGEHAACVAFTNGFDIAAFLQQFTAHVQRQIGRVDHAFDEAQIHGHEGFGIVHDEHAFDIQLQTGFFVAVEQVHRRFAGDVEQLRVFGAAFNAVVAPCQWGFEVVADVFVKLGVLLVGHVFFGTCPQGVGLVDGIPFVGDDHFAGLIFLPLFPLFFAHANRQRNVIGVFVDDRFELPGAQVFLGVITQVQDDVGATVFLGDGFHLKVAGAGAAPAHAFFGLQTCAA